MKVKGLIINFICVSIVVLGIFQASVNGRPLLLSLDRPRPDDAAEFARWLVCQNSWASSVLKLFYQSRAYNRTWFCFSTISNDWGGAPFGNVVSFSDGLPDKGKGIPYFYLTTLDPTASNALKDQRSSLTISEYNLGTCGKKDPENPTCAKITLIGKLKLLDGDSEEAEFAQTALFTKHREMKGWPKSHKFQIFKLDIEDIFMINWYGGPKPLTVDQYLHTKMNKLIFHADSSS